MSIIGVAEAVEKLKQGEVVAIPTETVYGLAGRIDNEVALKKIFALKKRPLFDPLIVHIEDVAQARALTSEWPEIYDELAKKFWPGPLTLLAPKSAKVSPLITSGLTTVALRSPAHPIAREILKKVGAPLAAPSANLFGKTSPTRAAHVAAEFSNEVSVVEGGACSVGLESTVLQARREGDAWKLEILRPGAVSRQDLRNALNGFKFTISRAHSEASPGSLKAHYQPRSPLVILNDRTWDDSVQLEVVKRLGRPILSRMELMLPDSAIEAARGLYAELRRQSRDEKHILWIERLTFHQGEDWEAVWDRLERASSVII